MEPDKEKIKPLFGVTLNWSGQLITIHTRANNEKEALKNAIHRLALNLGLDPVACWQRFGCGKKSNFTIKQIDPYERFS